MIFVIERDGEPVGAIKVDHGAPAIMINRELAYGPEGEEPEDADGR